MYLATCCALAAATPPGFEADVLPILQAKCVMCHGAAPQGKLDLRSQQAILNGGASGPVVVPGESGKSLLLTKVVTRQMPPGNVKLTEAEIDQIRMWIDKGLAVAAPVTVSEHEVRAIFQVRCVLCHGSGDRKGGLDMRTVASRLKGGKSGPGLVPGKPEESLIYQRIVKGADAAGQARQGSGGGIAHGERDRKDPRVDRRRRTRTRRRSLCRPTPW